MLQYVKTMLQSVLKAYGLNPAECRLEPIGSGLINRTWRVSDAQSTYVLQHVNTHVFRDPESIAINLKLLANYLKDHNPSYLFPAPLPACDGRQLVWFDGECYRLLPFIQGSHTVDFLIEPGLAYEAARQFGKLTSLLSEFDANRLVDTIPNFHNLSLRIDQFHDALNISTVARLHPAQSAIKQVLENIDIADQYQSIINEKSLPVRVVHHDTKINNVLFNDKGRGLCVIDLDTVMPGHFISDVGDMMRTYLSETNEEEQQLDKIRIREKFFTAIYAGYMEQMGGVFTDTEKELFVYSGKFMIYMQAVRFLTDYLRGDVYYQTTYPGQNLVRANNQLTLLNRYKESEPLFNNIVQKFGNVPGHTGHQK